MWYNGRVKMLCPSDADNILGREHNLIGGYAMDTLSSPAENGNPYIIYALIDPCDGSIKYVGMSINPELRLRAHLTDKEATPQKRAWLDGLLALNIIPTILPLETAIHGKREARKRENFWISVLSEAGEELLNSPPIGGRLRSRRHVEEILRFYQDYGEFPDDVSPSMRRYYKREYPEFFRRRRSRSGRSMRCYQVGIGNGSTGC